MSIASRKNRIAFRPFLGDLRLEERVVLNGAAPAHAARAAEVSTFQTGGSATNRTGVANHSTQQISNASRQQLNATRSSPRQFAGDQVGALFNNRANFGAHGRLIPRLQNSLLGGQNHSQSGRIANQVDSNRPTRSRAMLQNAIHRPIGRTFTNHSARVTNVFNTAPLIRLSSDPATGQSIGLGQFLANQAVTQTNNTFGPLANGVGLNAQAALFATTDTFNPWAAIALQRQIANAVGAASFQMSGLLSLFPGPAMSLAPQLQSISFGNSINPATGLQSTSFLNSLSGVLSTTGMGVIPTFNAGGINPGFQSGSLAAFQSFASPLNDFFGTQPSGTAVTTVLPNGFFQTGATSPGVPGPQFISTGFNNGVNKGVNIIGGSLPGFGIAPAGFDPGFGTGFNPFLNSLNQQLGVIQPSITTGISMGSGPAIGPVLSLGTGGRITTGVLAGGTGLLASGGTLLV